MNHLLAITDKMENDRAKILQFVLFFIHSTFKSNALFWDNIYV